MRNRKCQAIELEVRRGVNKQPHGKKGVRLNFRERVGKLIILRKAHLKQKKLSFSE